MRPAAGSTPPPPGASAATVAALVDRRRLRWEQPMVSVLPDFRLHDAYAVTCVNARDLLTHRSGFPAFFGDLFDHLAKAAPTCCAGSAT
jgi:CubicO group peptidase (beta-lactamase class C family)